MSHWVQKAKALGADVEIQPSESFELGEDDSNFMISAEGQDGLYAVFEDSAETGWLYICDSLSQRILKATHVYNRSNASVEAKDVDVGWSAEGEVGCVAIWEQMRAFLSVKRSIEMRKPITHAELDGFYASEWPEGFAHMLKKEE